MEKFAENCKILKDLGYQDKYNIGQNRCPIM